jgi:hypothetical protein
MFIFFLSLEILLYSAGIRLWHYGLHLWYGVTLEPAAGFVVIS